MAVNAAVNADPAAERPSLTLTRRLRARPENVYAAWTQAAQLAQWFGPPNMKPATLEAELDVRVGGRYRLAFTRDDGEYFEAGGTYREVVPNEKLVFTWAWHSTPERESLVTITLKPDSAGTLMVFHHAQFADETARDNHRRGWSSFFDKLDAFVACPLSEEDIMQQHQIVSRDQWIAARKAHLAHEKELTQARERLAEERRRLPWVKVDKSYVFDGPHGKVTLDDLFKERPQLVVQHVMFAPDWDAACKSCSFWVDGFERMVPHLAARDTSMVAISLAPVDKLEAFKKRMGWTFDWVSSGNNDFNYDYEVSFTREQIDKGEQKYNFGTTPFYGPELPGISVFYRDEAGTVFHTYSCFARGLDMMNAAYQYLDLTPLGRHEDGLPYPMDWVRLRDQYQPDAKASCCHG
jgi:predicted dithiol-disulfide oxidoreductase (DUF899 family)/uncharacterized protein YndB with AHSA1/START domain